MLNRCTVAIILAAISIIYLFEAWHHQERRKASLSLAYLALAIAEVYRM